MKHPAELVRLQEEGIRCPRGCHRDALGKYQVGLQLLEGAPGDFQKMEITEFAGPSVAFSYVGRD